MVAPIHDIPNLAECFPTMLQVPLMTIEGNHEIEEDAAGKTFLSYTARYRMPAPESGSPSQLYYSFDLGGKLPFLVQPDCPSQQSTQLTLAVVFVLTL